MRPVYLSLIAGLLIIVLAAAACPLFDTQNVYAIAPATESQVSTQNDLYAVWGTSATNVFAVGQNGTILHYDGLAWTAMNSSTSEDLYAVWGTSATNVFAAGRHGTILHYNSVSWESMIGIGYTLSAIWGISDTNVFAVGQRGIILNYNDTMWKSTASGAWISTPSSTSRYLYGLWGNSSTNA